MYHPFAFVFPGQGSQSAGMLTVIAEYYELIPSTFAEASEALGFDLWHMVQHQADQLNLTANTQPALLTAGVALWRLWQQQGGTNPVALAGHSLGEYTALTCAQAISLADAVRLVTQRGELMQQAVPVGSGAMAAIIGLNEQQVETACQQAAEGQVVAPANYNAPDQVVIAGQAEAVKRAMTACQQAGARRTLPLPVSVPSHCELMRPAAVELQQSLDQIPIAEPQLPVFNNVDGQTATDPTQIRQRLVEQLYQPVQWVKLVKQMIASKGINHLIECGPGRVLTGLGRRIDRSLTLGTISAPEDFDRWLNELQYP